MADLEQGIKYTIEVDASKAEKTLSDVGKTAENAGEKAIAGFSPMKAVTDALHGNIAGLGSELAKLVPAFRKLAGGGAVAMGAVGAAVYAVFKLLVSLKDLFKTVFNLNGPDKNLQSVALSFEKMRTSAERFAEEMKESRENAAQMTKQFNDTAEAINKMTKAQNEFARAQELSLAKSEEQKALINSKYDRLNEDSDANTRIESAKRRRDDLNDELKRLERELSESKRREREYSKFREKLIAKEREEESAEMERLAKEEKRLDDELAAERKRAENELAAIRKDAEKHIHDLKMMDLKSERQAEAEALKEQSDAESRLAAAKSAVQRAWGWYRDKDSMKAQMDEEKANAEAERQYEKDFEKLRYRRDWRTAKNLSVDQEATRRVALAKEEETAAQKAVAETAENTARAADAVEAIQKALEESGNVD